MGTPCAHRICKIYDSPCLPESEAVCAPEVPWSTGPDGSRSEQAGGSGRIVPLGGVVWVGLFTDLSEKCPLMFLDPCLKLRAPKARG